MISLENIKNRTCVIYARRSDTSKDNQEKSITEQLQICKSIAKDINLKIIKTYVDEDEGWDKRPSFQQLKQDIKSGNIKPQFLICWKRDRISRQFIGDYKADLQPLVDAGVLLLPSDTRKPQRFFSSQRDTIGSIGDILEQNKNAEYSVNLADTIANRSYPKASSGNLFSKDCFGWITERTFRGSKVVDRKRIPHPEDSIIVKELFEKFINTKSLSSLVPILDKSSRYPKKKCTACVERLKANGKKRIGLAVDQTVSICTNKYKTINNDGDWVELTCGSDTFINIQTKTPDIRSILRNQTHCGDYSYYKTNTGKYRQRVDNKVIDVEEHKENNISIKKRQNINPINADVYIQDTHEGIIDRQTFIKVQEILDGNKTTSNQNRKKQGLYSGLVKCGTCGSNLTFRSTQGFDKYVCDSSVPRRNQTSKCQGGTKQIRESDLEDIILDNVAEKLSTPLYWYKALREMSDIVSEREINNINSNIDNDIKDIKDKIKSLDDIIHKIDYSNPIESLKSDAIFQQKLNLESELRSLADKKLNDKDQPIFELLEKTKENNWAIIESSFLSQDIEIWGNEFTPPDNIRVVGIDDLILGVKPNCAVLCRGIDGIVTPVADNLDIVLELLTGSVQERLLLAYCITRYNKRENLEKRRKVLSVFLAESFRKEINKIEWSRVQELLYQEADIQNIVKDITIEFTPVEDIENLDNAELAYKMKHTHNKNVASSYKLRLQYDDVGDQYQRSHSYCFHITG